MKGKKMRGFPKNFCTKQDYLNMIADPEHSEEAKNALKGLANDRFIWVPSEKKYTSEELTEDVRKHHEEQNECLINTAKEDEEEVWTVFVQKEDENAEVFRLGFTLAEVENLTE